MSGSRYVLTFIDDFSRFNWVFFLKKKYEVLDRFTEFKASIENASGRRIKSLRYDNGGYYIKSDLLQICAKYGIQIQHYIPYTPRQNGIAERKNQALKEMTTCMLESKGLAANLSAEAINFYAHIQNSVTHSSMKYKTPFIAYLDTSRMCQISRFLGPLHGLEFCMTRGKI